MDLLNVKKEIENCWEFNVTNTPETVKGIKREFIEAESSSVVTDTNTITDYFKVVKSSKDFPVKKVKTAHPDEVTLDFKIPSIPCHLEGKAYQFLQLELEMTRELMSLSFSDPVHCIYNPLEYAFATHCDFVRKYCNGEKKFLLLGMNPGPFGMVQTGVPFGEIEVVQDWLQVSGEIKKPSVEHPKRPILGFDCHRSEVSGRRFWGYFKKRCTTPERFFSHCFVYNMCPLTFMNATGKNLTPPSIKIQQRKVLNAICDKYLCCILKLLQVKVIIGIGNFARDRAKEALKKGGMMGVTVEVILHPSPASPAANKGWESVVQKQLKDIGLDPYL